VVAVRRVIIKGTTDQIALAKSLIQEKVTEDIEMREKIQESVDRRSPRKKMGPQYLMSAEALEVCLTAVESRSIDPATFVFPYLPRAIFGPE
jgi:hypothetical protein